jgi:AraC-like DNA-binding protein
MYVTQPRAAGADDRDAPNGDWTELELGLVRMSVLRFPQLSVPTAPEDWPLALASDGPLTVDGDEARTRLEPGDLVLWEPSRAFDARAVLGAAPPRALILHLPRHAVPVPDRALRDLVARPVPSDKGPGALLARFVEGLAEQPATVSPPQAGRLGSAAVSLSVAFLTELTDLAADGGAAVPDRPRRAAHVRDITAYIDRHLREPDLTPAMIAAAHHISVRYLHLLFQQDGRTVAGYVRTQRLERCRADLTDPRLADRAVNEIRSRWGFRDAAAFSRAFTRAYGISPGEHRRRHLAA